MHQRYSSCLHRINQQVWTQMYWPMLSFISCSDLFLPSVTFPLSGYPSYPRHHPSLPECSDSARPDLPLAPVLWYPVGPGPAQQVRVPGALQARPAAGAKATSGEVAEGRQGIVDQPPALPPLTGRGSSWVAYLFTWLFSYLGSCEIIVM